MKIRPNFRPYVSFSRPCGPPFHPPTSPSASHHPLGTVTTSADAGGGGGSGDRQPKAGCWSTRGRARADPGQDMRHEARFLLIHCFANKTGNRTANRSSVKPALFSVPGTTVPQPAKSLSQYSLHRLQYCDDGLKCCDHCSRSCCAHY
jgi:hypothetical protein